MEFKPLGERVLVQIKKAEESTDSGIYVGTNDNAKVKEAEVIAIGADVQNITVGNCVIFNEQFGSEIELDGETYLILETEEIYGVLT